MLCTTLSAPGAHPKSTPGGSGCEGGCQELRKVQAATKQLQGDSCLVSEIQRIGGCEDKGE